MGHLDYGDFSIVPMLAEEETAVNRTPTEAEQPRISQPPLSPVLDHQKGSDNDAMLQRKK